MGHQRKVNAMPEAESAQAKAALSETMSRPWLASLPEGWTVQRIKHVARFAGGGTPSKAVDDYWGGHIPWVSPKDMKVFRITETQDYITNAAVGSSACSLIPAGSALMVVRSGILQHTIPMAINDVPVCLNQDMKALIPEDGMLSEYLAYLVQGLNDRFLDEWVKQGATVESIEHESMANTPIPVPPTDHQLAIATYLGAETKRIDGLIEEKKRLQDSLIELKVRRITEILTGEVDATQPTGDIWLPKIPVGWELKRLKHLGQVRSGLAKGKKHESGVMTVELPYMRVANVQDGYIDLSDVTMIEVAESEVERYTLRMGDVLMNEGGDYDKLGRGAMWEGRVKQCLHQNHVFAVRLDDVKWAPWVAAVTRTSYAKFYFMNNSKQSTNLASINQTNVKEFPVVIPPVSQRDELLRILTDELRRIDDLVRHVEQELEVLAEFRSSTITDAVLGRIDVRPA